jgi:hypothetical protein
MIARKLAPLHRRRLACQIKTLGAIAQIKAQPRSGRERIHCLQNPTPGQRTISLRSQDNSFLFYQKADQGLRAKLSESSPIYNDGTRFMLSKISAKCHQQLFVF